MDERKAFSTTNLANDFCDPNDHLAHALAREFFEILITRPTRRTAMLRSEWEQLFRLSHDEISQQRRIEERRVALGRVVGAGLEEPDREYAALFALQTTYAVIVKLIAYRVLAEVRLKRPIRRYDEWLESDALSLQITCKQLEDGDLFRQSGIENLLEGDFFSWYAHGDQWTDTVAGFVRRILAVLRRYENATLLYTHSGVMDVFKGLYEALMPQAVRSSLGEFYTPAWLGEHVLRTVKPRHHTWRGLDPCAGSGTFVLAMIAAIREESADRSPTDLLHDVLGRVCGIDINPLGVLTTRINYFIAIADLIPEDPQALHIPVYLGDACQTPRLATHDGVGQFDLIVGNPPWIDWKNLPSGYRERIKSLCIDRGIFSGDGRTGGINLNICALIANVSIQNWLASRGRLAFLMPAPITVQQSYQGFRRLSVDGKLFRFGGFVDWREAGHPFEPVRERFMTFVICPGRQRTVVPLWRYRKRPGQQIAGAAHLTLAEAMTRLECSRSVAGQITDGSTAFTVASDRRELRQFARIAGSCPYIGREGIEFYPQELLLFRLSDLPAPSPATRFFENVQIGKSKHKIPRQLVELEIDFMFPLVKGPEIEESRHAYSGIYVPFPYDPSDARRPLDMTSLRDGAPRLLQYYITWREMFEKQTKFSDKIRGEDAGEFYGLARVGPYSFQEHYVGFRDNTTWCATVIASTETPFGRRRMLFQNHAVSMCEDGTGRYISEAEAHYICAIFNTPIVRNYIYQSSDERSFKIRPPVNVPVYDADNEDHRRLAALSRDAHRHQDPDQRERIAREAERIYLKQLG